MSSTSLERTIDKVLSQKESELKSQIDLALQESLNNLNASKTKLQSEYDGIIESAKKQAENLKRQIIGSSKLNVRNKELVLMESAINDIFFKAKEKLISNYNEKNYKRLLIEMLTESFSNLDSNEMIVECNKADKVLVKKIVSEISDKKKKLSLVDNNLNIIGGVKISSSDGTMTLDNTLDSLVEKLKPLIRKEIVQLLRGE